MKYCKACEFWIKKESIENTKNELSHIRSNAKRIMRSQLDGSGWTVIEIFLRSEDFHNGKFVNYIGDVDSKTFKGILDAKSYADVTVCKKECIDHVYKSV